MLTLAHSPSIGSKHTLLVIPLRGRGSFDGDLVLYLLAMPPLVLKPPLMMTPLGS